MKAHPSQKALINRRAQHCSGGFALIEALFVVAILTTIGLLGLRSIANLGKASLEETAVVSKIESKAAAEWSCERLPSGERAWFRKI